MQNLKKQMAASQPRCRQEAVGWHASHNQTNGFEGFESFVTKK
jgi:hypothetical protein